MIPVEETDVKQELDLSQFEGATAGPWRWEIGLEQKRVQLCGGKPLFDRTVVDFVRWGMGGAAPRFVDHGDLKLLARCDRFARVAKGREHHASWFQLLDQPDANLIATAPQLLDEVKRLRVELAKYRGGA